MGRDRWTLVILPEDRSRLRQYQLGRGALQTIIGGVLVVLSVLVSLAGGFFVKESQSIRVDRLSRENSLLETEVRQIRGQVATLRSTLDELASRDAHFRLMAGLDPIDREVQQVGIGGPGTPLTVPSGDLWRLNPGAGELSFATSSELDHLLRRARLLSSSWSEASTSLDEVGDRLRSTPSLLPTDGYLSSAFSHSRLHPILNEARAHEGIDISAAPGTPIQAAARGTVVFAGPNGGYGNMIEIDHGYGLLTRYAHASRVDVREGLVVERGRKIGEVGSTGLSVSPHLHYEVHHDGRPVDPRRYILDPRIIRR